MRTILETTKLEQEKRIEETFDYLRLYEFHKFLQPCCLLCMDSTWTSLHWWQSFQHYLKVTLHSRNRKNKKGIRMKFCMIYKWRWRNKWGFEKEWNLCCVWTIQFESWTSSCHSFFVCTFDLYVRTWHILEMINLNKNLQKPKKNIQNRFSNLKKLVLHIQLRATHHHLSVLVDEGRGFDICHCLIPETKNKEQI